MVIWWNLMITNNIRTEKKATDTYIGFTNKVGGWMPMIRSRSIPPPTAVVTPNTIIPNKSKCFRMATMPPEQAKAAVPIISIAKNTVIWFKCFSPRLYSIIIFWFYIRVFFNYTTHPSKFQSAKHIGKFLYL